MWRVWGIEKEQFVTKRIKWIKRLNTMNMTFRTYARIKINIRLYVRRMTRRVCVCVCAYLPGSAEFGRKIIFDLPIQWSEYSPFYCQSDSFTCWWNENRRERMWSGGWGARCNHNDTHTDTRTRPESSHFKFDANKQSHFDYRRCCCGER